MDSRVRKSVGTYFPRVGHISFINPATRHRGAFCDCEALARLRFRYLGMHFTKPSDYHEVLLNKMLHYTDGAGLLAD
jgi:hypothetical protein